MLSHLSEGFLVFWMIKVGTDSLLLPSLVFKFHFWMLTSAPGFSAHQRCGHWGQREREMVIRCGTSIWLYKIVVQGVCSYPGCSTEKKTGIISPEALLCASLCRRSIPEAYRNAHNQEKGFSPALKDCSVRKWKTHYKCVLARTGKPKQLILLPANKTFKRTRADLMFSYLHLDLHLISLVKASGLIQHKGEVRQCSRCLYVGFCLVL